MILHDSTSTMFSIVFMPEFKLWLAMIVILCHRNMFFFLWVSIMAQRRFTSSCPAASGGAEPLLGRRVDLRPWSLGLMEIGILNLWICHDNPWYTSEKLIQLFICIWKNLQAIYLCQPCLSSWAVQVASSSWEICRFSQFPSKASSRFGNDRESV